MITMTLFGYSCVMCSDVNTLFADKKEGTSVAIRRGKPKSENEISWKCQIYWLVFTFKVYLNALFQIMYALIS